MKKFNSVQNMIDTFNSTCSSLTPVSSLNPKQKVDAEYCLATYGFEKIKLAFEKVSESDFLSGRNDKKWRANFIWIINPKNFKKIINGYYDNFKNVKNEQRPVETDLSTELSESNSWQDIPEYSLVEFENKWT